MNQTIIPARHAKMPRLSPPEPMLPETLLRQCPACQSKRIVHAGYVVGGGGMIKSQHRCEGCGTAFWFVRKQVPGVPPPPWDEGGLRGGSSSAS